MSTKIDVDINAFIELQAALAPVWAKFAELHAGPAMTVIVAAGAMHQMGFTNDSIRALLESAIATFPKLDAVMRTKPC